MKFNKIVFGLISTAFLFTGACGLYTNVPAQYHVSGDSDMVATVTYDTAKNATVKLPKLVIAGEPGSIGVTFNSMSITYNTGEVAAANIPITLRVDSSHLRDKEGKLEIGKGSIQIPVVNPRIIEIGRRQGVSNIAATISISGNDDAGWPTSFDIGGVPIVFISSP